jgi:transcription initiation factor TFIID subunit 6
MLSRSGKQQSTEIHCFNIIQDVAESLGLTNLSDVIASALASDVEYRIQQVIEVLITFGTKRV